VSGAGLSIVSCCCGWSQQGAGEHRSNYVFWQRVEEYPDLPFNYHQSYVDGTADAMATPPETDNSLDSKSEDEVAYNQTANDCQPTHEEKQLVCGKRLVLLFVTRCFGNTCFPVRNSIGLIAHVFP
jgi:hypothetical protein